MSSKPAKAAKSTPTPGNRSGGVAALLDRFMAAFQGYSKAYGTFELRKADEKGKVQGKPLTVGGTPTRDVYERHLKGTGPGLGIIMLRDDDTVMFGAIDYDNKKTDHQKLEAKVRELKLPLVVCRSKSGGAHLYAFTTAPVPATLMRERLAEWTAMLGMAANTEQFPKQAARFNDNDIGSWINLPYFNAEATDRYAVEDGQPVDLARFLELVAAHRSTPEYLEKQTVDDDENALFYEGPPCLQMISRQGGFVEGTRNDGIQAVIVYLKKRYPDDWESRVDGYNTSLAGLGSAEVQEIIKGNRKKDYNYACKRPPINSFCQRRLCLSRMYGVGEGAPESRGHEIGALTRYDSPHGDPPMWGMEINGKRVMVSHDEFYSRDAFNKAVMAQANLVPIHMPPQRWLKYLGDIIQSAETVMLPAEASPTGQLWEWIEKFTTQQANALTREEIWLGKPFRSEGRVYFRSHDLFRYLKGRRADYKSEVAVYQLLKAQGGETNFWHLKGRGVNVWSLPLPQDLGLDPEGKDVHVDQDREF